MMHYSSCIPSYFITNPHFVSLRENKDITHLRHEIWILRASVSKPNINRKAARTAETDWIKCRLNVVMQRLTTGLTECYTNDQRNTLTLNQLTERLLKICCEMNSDHWVWATFLYWRKYTDSQHKLNTDCFWSRCRTFSGFQTSFKEMVLHNCFKKWLAWW